MFKKAFILYGCQIYKAVLPLAFTPLILNTLGAERYGMIAFFYMLVGLLGLLDAGVSGSFLKLVATNRSKLISYKKVTILFCKVFVVFIFISIVLWLCFFIGDEYIATNWLNTSIESSEATYAIKTIGFILATLYIKSYLSSFLNGMEKQEWVTIWSVGYSSLFYFLSYYAIKNIDDTLIAFFKVMFVLSLLDLLVVICLVMVVYFKHYRILSLELLNKGAGSNFSCDDELSLKRTLRFSIQLSGLSIIWVVATQIDKFILSAYISLDEYAKYQIAVQLCSVIAIFSGPLTQILLPRLSSLYASNQLQEYSKLYCSSIILFIGILSPLLPYFFIFGNDLITLWMKDTMLSQSINMYAKWLMAASFIAATMNFVFICLYSLGQLKYHFYAYATYSLFTIPLSIFVAKNYGAIGSAKFVFFHTLIFMLVWGGWQMKKKFPGFFNFLALIYIFIIVLSSSVFLIMSITLGESTYLAVRVFIPPLCNFLLLCGLFFMFRCKIISAISSVKLI